MPMNLKTRKYIQLVATLAEKRRQQASENLKLVGNLPQQLLPQQVEEPQLQLKTEDELAQEQLERSKMISPLEALQQNSENADGWEPFAPRSKL